jgi:hypothetical protein
MSVVVEVALGVKVVWQESCLLLSNGNQEKSAYVYMLNCCTTCLYMPSRATPAAIGDRKEFNGGED